MIVADADGMRRMDKKLRVVLVIFGGLKEGPPASTGRRVHQIEDQGVLIDLGSAAVWLGSVGDDEALAGIGFGKVHDPSLAAVDFGGNESGVILGIATVFHSGTGGGAEIALVEVPLRDRGWLSAFNNERAGH